MYALWGVSSASADCKEGPSHTKWLRNLDLKESIKRALMSQEKKHVLISSKLSVFLNKIFDHSISMFFLIKNLTETMEIILWKMSLANVINLSTLYEFLMSSKVLFWVIITFPPNYTRILNSRRYVPFLTPFFPPKAVFIIWTLTSKLGCSEENCSFHTVKCHK